MGLVTISRQNSSIVATIASSAALSEAVDMRQFSGGVISMPGTWTSASLAFKHSASKDGTYQPLYNSSGTLVEMTVSASKEFAIPSDVFGCQFIKLWSETSASDVNQGGSRSITVSLKG